MSTNPATVLEATLQGFTCQNKKCNKQVSGQTPWRRGVEMVFFCSGFCAVEHAADNGDEYAKQQHEKMLKVRAARTQPKKHFKYGIICDEDCGIVELSEAEYMRQLSRPDSFWKCPTCGSSADWDDDSEICQ